MQIDKVKRILTTPVSDEFAMSTPEFRNREYINITYKTDFDKLRELVPEPLEIDEPLVKFELIKMPDSTGLGDYLEGGQVIPVSYNGVPGEFSLGMYLNNFPAIVTGREFSTYPKKYGNPSLYVDSDTLVGKLSYGTLDVAIATMRYKYNKITPEEAGKIIGTPQYMLKIIRDTDMKLLACKMTVSTITKYEILEAWRSPARLQLFEHVNAPLADLPVKQVVDATHIIANLMLGRPSVVYDYLK